MVKNLFISVLKPITSLIRRPDGLRRLECQILTVRRKGKGKQRKERIAESRLRRLNSRGCARPLAGHEEELVKTWRLLGKATLSRRTYRLLRRICVVTASAPRPVVTDAPRLSASSSDIRPWLCDPAALVSFFQQLREFDLEEKGGICDSEDEDVVYDPWLMERSGECIPLGEVELAPVVWERAACFSVDSCYEELIELEQAYLDCLEGKGMPELMEIVLGHTGAQGGAHWIHLWRRVPDDVRVKEIEHWMIHHVQAIRCTRGHVYLVSPACACDPEHYRGLDYLWKGIVAGADISQMLDGIGLWQEFGWDSIPEVYPGGTVDTHTLIRLTKLLATREFQSTVSATLWDTMHLHPGLTNSLQAVLDQPYGHRGWLVRLLRCAKSYSPSVEVVEAFNRDFEEVARRIFEMPEDYREKAVVYFEWLYWDETLKMPAAALMECISCLCRKPFSTTLHGKYVWQELMCSWGGVTLPLASWKRIDGACRSETQASVLEKGFEQWDKDFARSLMRRGLHLRVRLSLEIIRLTCRSLSPVVEVAFEKLREHPLLGMDIRTRSGAETFSYLGGPGKDLEKWCRHLSGECPLRKESARQLWERLEGVRVEKLLVYFREELSEPSTENDGLQLHTRLYATAADENRRAYNKLIRRYRELGEQGILSHPRNQQWLRAHPFVRKGVWLTGLRAEIELSDGSRVFLETERRFEQVLKMGTLVDSCLALDGCNSHSALANAADVNKQVVMAYDARQRFLGRQLIAISEQRQLVVFDVYGQDSSRLEPAFAAFDFQLGNLLAMPLRDGGEYEIQRVVCREWYDDYAWRPERESEARIIDRQWGGSLAEPDC